MLNKLTSEQKEDTEIIDSVSAGSAGGLEESSQASEDVSNKEEDGSRYTCSIYKNY